MNDAKRWMTWLLGGIAGAAIFGFSPPARADLAPPNACVGNESVGQSCNTALTTSGMNTGTGTCQQTTCSKLNYFCDAGADGAPAQGPCGTVSNPCVLCLGPDGGTLGSSGGSSGSSSGAAAGGSGSSSGGASAPAPSSKGGCTVERGPFATDFALPAGFVGFGAIALAFARRSERRRRRG